MVIERRASGVEVYGGIDHTNRPNDTLSSAALRRLWNVHIDFIDGRSFAVGSRRRQ